jgi:hypothetical protein
MSYISLTSCTRDPKMLDRVQACVVQEAAGGMADTPFGEAINAHPDQRWGELVWPVALNCEADYESAWLSDPDEAWHNVMDNQILAAVQAHWPDA